jgi:hypothetical protein
MKTIACTLTRNDLAERRARWQALAARSLVGIDETETGLRLRFAGERSELEALAALERDCCSFATWTIDGTTLAIDGGSPEAVAAVRGMFLSLR